MREDWIEYKLGEIHTIVYGKGLPTKNLTSNGYPVFGANGIIGYYTEYKYENQQILISCRGAASGAINVSPKKCFITNNSLIVETDSIPYIEKSFLYYILQGANRTQIITGSAQPQVTINNANTLVLKLAPLPIQRAIVLKIENLFASLDKGIADLKTAQEQLKVYRQAVLKKAFEGKFTNKNVKEGELPEGWKWVKLGEVAEVNPKLPKKEEINSTLEVQFLPMKLVEEEINKIHLIETKLFHEVQKGSYTPFINNDIIFAKVTPCMENGKIAITNNLKNGIGYGSSEFHVIRCKGEILNTYIFHYVVQSRFRKEAENQMTGAVGLRRVPKKFLEDYTIPLSPTLTEQHAIVREIESRLSVCDKVEQSIAEALEKAEALRQSILKKAFEGDLLSEAEIAKCKQEADYEPAAKLLERIKKDNRKKY